ncbi:hypothetical protein [Kribbella italica]|uniref:HEAT repeat domain-containing protein n=1 Tax=Kribbella italica TaxID=1540520 RepID=A0A7W9MV67_9ACTN|nr:hypothetical protein [Kribbella italica]MBB5837494.1 hypothetical protein [Kribbella italica]
MTIDELEAEVGPELFRRTCERAWATALTTGRGPEDPWPADEADVPHTIADHFAGDAAFGFQVYRRMPCYGVLMYVGHEPRDDAFWSAISALLDDSDDRLAAPVQYWLWCGPFEEATVSGALFEQLVANAPDLRVRRLLEVSGPVPWSAKAPLLKRLAGRPLWDSAVLHALEWAAYDVYGQIDPREATSLLRKLPAGRTTELQAHLETLTPKPSKQKKQGRRR